MPADVLPPVDCRMPEPGLHVLSQVSGCVQGAAVRCGFPAVSQSVYRPFPGIGCGLMEREEDRG